MPLPQENGLFDYMNQLIEIDDSSINHSEENESMPTVLGTIFMHYFSIENIEPLLNLKESHNHILYSK